MSLLEGRAHADTTLSVTHTAAHCESREYYKTILDDESTGVYQGKVVVAPGAQKTDGKMLSKAIFLADGANMYNKPELEIFADDVVCGHGATVGYLDDEPALLPAGPRHPADARRSRCCSKPSRPMRSRTCRRDARAVLTRASSDGWRSAISELRCAASSRGERRRARR